MKAIQTSASLGCQTCQIISWLFLAYNPQRDHQAIHVAGHRRAIPFVPWTRHLPVLDWAKPPQMTGHVGGCEWSKKMATQLLMLEKLLGPFNQIVINRSTCQLIAFHSSLHARAKINHKLLHISLAVQRHCSNWQTDPLTITNHHSSAFTITLNRLTSINNHDHMRIHPPGSFPSACLANLRGTKQLTTALGTSQWISCHQWIWVK